MACAHGPYGLHTNWLSCFLIEEKRFGCSRDELIGVLDAAGIESRPVWKPMHLQPLYAGCARYGGEAAEICSAAESVCPVRAACRLKTRSASSTRCALRLARDYSRVPRKNLVALTGVESVWWGNGRCQPLPSD